MKCLFRRPSDGVISQALEKKKDPPRATCAATWTLVQVGKETSVSKPFVYQKFCSVWLCPGEPGKKFKVGRCAKTLAFV